MNFTMRVLLGNISVIIVTIAALVILNPSNSLIPAIVIGLAIIIASTLTQWVLCRKAFAPLDAVVQALEKAAEGDLSVKVVVTEKGELKRLADSFNKMMGDMNRAMRQFFSVADLVRDSVGMVGETTASMVTVAEDVAMQAGTIATASEEMSATSGDIARNCLYAAENAQKVVDETHKGSELVKNSSYLMDNIARRVNAASGTVEGLGKRSDQIGAIVNTIQDIADQTNLLALNAAIEAARAGEYGRGFAVVADEVRALAERTTKATKEISSMINSIQAETQSAVASMAEGVGEVKRGTDETGRSGDALESILIKINDLTMQVSQIATAAEEQTATTQEITNNIQTITDVVSRNVENARSTTRASNLLVQQVDELHALVSNFRLGKAIEWDDSFSTGVSLFDQQHQRLFDMVNELHDAMQQKRSKDAIGSILNGLAEYTVNHFGDEERLFAQTSYPDEARHKALHKNLVDQVVELIGKFKRGEALMTQEVIIFLKDWLVNHIKGVDRNYGPHLNRNGIR